MDTLFKKIPQKKVSDKVFDQIRDLITQGRLQPGDRLPPERELTALFQVSRSSVREAILKLECLGFVEQRHGEGTFIKSVTDAPLTNFFEAMLQRENSIFDLMDMRNALETWGAATAAERATEAELRQLDDCLEGMRQARHEGKIGYELNLRFHFLISRAAHNPFLLHTMNTISEWIKQVTHEIFSDLYHDLDVYDTLFDQHSAIVTAIRNRDREAASDAMAAHLRYAVEQVRASQTREGRN